MNEAWTLQRKRKQGQMMKRKANVISRARKRKLKRRADPEALKRRAQKVARGIVFKKLAAGKTKGELASRQAILSIEKKLDKHKSKINKLAMKILPKVKKDEADRLKKMRQGDIDPSKDAG